MRLFQAKHCLLLTALAVAVPLPARNGESAPKLKLKDLEGQSQNLRQYLGRPVVLNFWATWCGPCQEEMPMLVAEEQIYRGRGVVFVGIALNDGKDLDKVRAFVAQQKAEYPVWMGTVDDLERFKLAPLIPGTAFIDPKGNIVGRVLGEIRKPELERRLEWLLGNQQGQPPSAGIFERLNRPVRLVDESRRASSGASRYRAGPGVSEESGTERTEKLPRVSQVCT